jgi:hypothetical protein
MPWPMAGSMDAQGCSGMFMDAHGCSWMLMDPVWGFMRGRKCQGGAWSGASCGEELADRAPFLAGPFERPFEPRGSRSERCGEGQARREGESSHRVRGGVQAGRTGAPAACGCVGVTSGVKGGTRVGVRVAMVFGGCWCARRGAGLGGSEWIAVRE